jgi:putative ABC transport system permease protein
MLLITTVISGLIPAVYLANFKPINTLKGNFSAVSMVSGLETES